MPLKLAEGLRGADVPLVGAFEIAMGKWQALSTWLAGRRYTGGDYVRHPMNLAAMSAAPGFERESLPGCPQPAGRRAKRPGHHARAARAAGPGMGNELRGLPAAHRPAAGAVPPLGVVVLEVAPGAAKSGAHGARAGSRSRSGSARSRVDGATAAWARRARPLSLKLPAPHYGLAAR